MGAKDDKTPTDFAQNLEGRPEYYAAMAAARGDEWVTQATKDLAHVTGRLVDQTRALKRATWGLAAIALGSLIWLVLHALVISRP